MDAFVFHICPLRAEKETNSSSSWQVITHQERHEHQAVCWDDLLKNRAVQKCTHFSDGEFLITKNTDSSELGSLLYLQPH